MPDAAFTYTSTYTGTGTFTEPWTKLPFAQGDGNPLKKPFKKDRNALEKGRLKRIGILKKAFQKNQKRRTPTVNGRKKGKLLKETI